MVPDLNIFRRVLLSLSTDSRITVWHMAVVFGIIQMVKSDDPSKPIFISRKQIMHYAHIGSFVTYHKCIKELQEFGYINYLPSYHPGIETKVFMCFP